MSRTFRADITEDKGTSWTHVRPDGWPVADLLRTISKTGYGYVIAINYKDTWIDVEIPKHVLPLMIKDIARLEEGDGKHKQQQRQTKSQETD